MRSGNSDKECMLWIIIINIIVKVYARISYEIGEGNK